MVFDKTGTVTQGGEPKITDYEFVALESAKSRDEKMVIGLLKRMEQDSSHPIAKAAVAFCQSREAGEVAARRIEEIAGKGLKGIFTTKESPGMIVEALVGNEVLMADYKVDISGEAAQIVHGRKTVGKSIALIATRRVSDDRTSTLGSISALCSFGCPPSGGTWHRQCASASQRRRMDDNRGQFYYS